MGKVSTLTVTGIVYTPRTAGLRVTLAGQQVDLFVGSDDYSKTDAEECAHEDVNKKKQHKGKKARKESSKLLSSNLPMVDEDVVDNSTRNSRGKKSSLETGKVNGGRSSDSKLAESPDRVKSNLAQDCRGVLSKAHITLGYSSTSQASQTGRDILDVVAFESQSKLLDIDRIALDDGQASIGYYGEGRCVVTLRQPLFINALFSGKY